MNIGGASNKFRLTGFATGFDTDQMVKDLMTAESAPLDKIKQKKQLAEWRQEAYRNVINIVRGFKDEYFDVLKPNYMLSQSAYKKFKVNSTDSNIVTAVADTTATSGDYKVTVERLATSAVRKSSSTVSKALTGTSEPTFTAGKSFTLTVDGTSKVITLENDTDSAEDLEVLIGNAFGTGKVSVSADATTHVLTFAPADIGVNKIIVSSGASNDALGSLGFNSSTSHSNRLSLNNTLEDVSANMTDAFSFVTEGEQKVIKFSINGESFKFNSTTTLYSMISTVNSNSNAGVNMQYDEITDTFRVTSKTTGAGDGIILKDIDSNFFEAAKLGSTSIFQHGDDAVINLKYGSVDQTITRSSNVFAVNGVTYTLHGISEPDTEETISLAHDADGVFDNIVGFVNKYNEMIDKINAKLNEEYDRDYQPLTDAQKEEMEDDQIDTWEEKAKEGLLRRDPLLKNFITNMRSALYDSVQNVSATLYNIGVTTGSYEMNGKLIVDETKLKNAIQTNPDAVMDLFSKESTSYSTGLRTLTSQQRSVRYKEEGLAYRISDIIEDNISTFRDTDGDKGLLLEKAGLVGDASQYDNLLYDEIYNYDKSINEWIEKLDTKEEAYYKRFSALETALSQMNNQASWLQSQLGTGG